MKKIIILVLFVFLLSSCTGVKKFFSKKTTTKDIQKTEINKDSSNVVEKNKAIKDKTIIAIPESETGDRDFDLAVNKAVSNILRSINFQKSSGDNNYKLYYDEKLRELRAEFEIGETKNKEIITNKNTNIEKTFEETVIENSKKVIKMIPLWLWLVFIWFFRKSIISVISIFIPGVRGINTIQDLFNPPKKVND